MNKKLLIPLILVLVVVIAIIGFSSKQTTPVSEQPEPGTGQTEQPDEEIIVSSEEGQPILGAADGSVIIYFFWGEGCPHCDVQKVFLEEMEQKYPGLEVKMYETWKDKNNANFFQEMARAYGVEARGVPTTFIGDYDPIVGFNETMKPDIENKIKTCFEQGCINPVEKM